MSQPICIVLNMIPIPCIFEIVQSPICSPITVDTLKYLINSPKLNRIPEENLFLLEMFDSFPKGCTPIPAKVFTLIKSSSIVLSGQIQSIF